MIEKSEFYHGAALVRLIEDPRCKTLGKHASGYCVNGQQIVVIKYSTKANSPWVFTFSQDDIDRLRAAAEGFESRGCLIALVCGGDGVCALSWSSVADLLGNAPGGISAKRPFSGCYRVTGPTGTLTQKIPMNRWPSIVFDTEDSA